MSFLAYPLAIEAGEILAGAWTAFALSLPIVGLALTEQDIGDFSHPSTKGHGRDTTEKPSSSMPQDMIYHFESPCLTPDVIMDVVNKRALNPVETPKPKRLDRNEKRDRDVDFTGPSYSAGWCRDFSAIQRTRVNPVTGRIIGYKGIRRKRSLSPTSKYSSFWRDQKYAKPSLHASRSPGIWDSARR
jgi:hypothetical protein